MKSKVKILIPQPEPLNCSPYNEFTSKHDVEIDFIPFFKINPIEAKEFRLQKIAIPNFTAIVFTSKIAIDAFFKLCEELKITVADSTKYFCISESIALYLQKYIVYRKRKIFFGTGTPSSIIDSIGSKDKEETFLLTVTDNNKTELNRLFAKSKYKHSSAILAKTDLFDLTKIELSRYNVVVFYSPSDVKSLTNSFPKLKQENLLFATFGTPTLKALQKAKFQAQIVAPTPEAPSIAKALLLHFEQK